MPRIALYPGSFDPVTNGHLDVLEHAVTVCDRLIVAVAVHPGKKSLFSTEERLEMLRAVCAPIVEKAGCAFEASTYDNLTVTAARAAGESPDEADHEPDGPVGSRDCVPGAPLCRYFSLCCGEDPPIL